MAKRESALKHQQKMVRTTRQKSNIESGILSDQNWQLVSWVVWIIFISPLERRSFTSVLLLELQSHMSLILLDL